MENTELIEQIKAAAKERAIEAAARIETLKLENELAYIQSDRYITDTIKESDNAILSAIIKPLEDITDKHFSHYLEFNFTSHANALIGAIKSVMLQKKLGFQALDEAKHLNPELMNFCDIVETTCQEFPDALGRNSYFDKLSGVIVPGQLGDAVATKQILETVARKLGMAKPNFDSVTQVRFSHIEERAQTKATTMFEDNQLLDPSNTDQVADVKFATA